MSLPDGKRILHVCNWYPNRFDTIEAQFIKDQIDALENFIPSDVMLIQVRQGSFQLITEKTSDREKAWIIRIPFSLWFVKEIVSSVALWIFFRFKYDHTRYSVVNFHIAYPLLTYFHFFKKRIRVPTVLSEHWSAYHFNFGVTRELKRIKKIFLFHPYLITVSRSLANDITLFAGYKGTSFQLPNVVNEKLFSVAYPENTEPVFFMLGCWQFPKVPWLILQALAVIKREGHKFKLRIGGYGPYEKDLRDLIVSSGLNESAEFIGKLTFEQAAREMKKASFFVHASEYETFSLVCVEALSCGTPVIASAVGGIPEYMHKENGILVASNNTESWAEALRFSYTRSFDRKTIAGEAFNRFSRMKVGEQYNAILQKITR